MNNPTIYALLARSGEKSRDTLEIAVYALCILSVVVAFWQFARQPLPLAEAMPVASQHSKLQDNT